MDRLSRLLLSLFIIGALAPAATAVVSFDWATVSTDVDIGGTLYDVYDLEVTTTATPVAGDLDDTGFDSAILDPFFDFPDVQLRDDLR